MTSHFAFLNAQRSSAKVRGRMEHDHAEQRAQAGRSPRRFTIFAVVGAVMLLLAVIGWVVWQRGNLPVAPLVEETRTPGSEKALGAVRPADRDRLASPVSKLAKSRSADMDDRFITARQLMVDNHMRRRDIADERILEVMQRVPRHLFVTGTQQDVAYADRPLSIGAGQTISQPYIVALMTQLAQPQPTSRALDVGTGSGYQAAILGELCQDVYSIEIVESLADQAQERLARLGYDNVRVRAGDGYRGWPEHAPFDVILVAAAPDHVPPPLVEQLAPGGRLIIPVGKFYQDLIVVEKQTDGTTRQWTEVPVAFVPMTGEASQVRSDD